MLVAGNSPPQHVLAGVMHMLMKLDQKLDTQQQQLAILLRDKASRDRCSGHGVDPSMRADSIPRDVPSAFKWSCPVCKDDFKHRDSLKGHIRELLNHVQCVWSDSNPEHRLLVHRFPGSNFNEKSVACSKALYEEMRACTSSMDTEEQTHTHISNWIRAAMIEDALVALPKYDVGNRQPRKRRNSASASSASSNSSSPHNVNDDHENIAFLHSQSRSQSQ